MDGPAVCYYAPSLFYRSSAHLEIAFWQSPHSVPPRRRLARWKRLLLRWLCGGGDVLVHMLRSHGNWHGRAEFKRHRMKRKQRHAALAHGRPPGRGFASLAAISGRCIVR